jgi:hypothetical protein
MSKMKGTQRESRTRMLGRQAQIVATHISRKLQIAGNALSPSELLEISQIYCLTWQPTCLV